MVTTVTANETPVEKSPAEEAAEEENVSQLNPDNAHQSESTSEELIRLRLENSALKTQMVALKNALQVFTE